MEESFRALGREAEFDVTIKFSNLSVLSEFLTETRNKIWQEEEAKKIYSDIRGLGWHKKLKGRLRGYKSNRGIPYSAFHKLCAYLKKDQNILLNLGKCTLLWRGTPWKFYDPYNIMPSKDYRKMDLVVV